MHIQDFKNLAHFPISKAFFAIRDAFEIGEYATDKIYRGNEVKNGSFATHDVCTIKLQNGLKNSLSRFLDFYIDKENLREGYRTPIK